MHKHALVERSILRYRLLTGPLRHLAKTKTQIAPTENNDPVDLNESAAIREAEALNPFIPRNRNIM